MKDRTSLGIVCTDVNRYPDEIVTMSQLTCYLFSDLFLTVLSTFPITFFKRWVPCHDCLDSLTLNDLR